ncbi:hypothetical protein NQ318_001539 [Aromia moschata]|uniref:Craniofacial development protein 2-like n=1 Tax=Aromia moschata TaxID=1265417 RepID=A0AAV8Y839_9CUCU|nr:hypothetical protein NQ318_001539 [Aromia moschata]
MRQSIRLHHCAGRYIGIALRLTEKVYYGVLGSREDFVRDIILRTDSSEHDLIHEFEQAEIDLLAITETKKKGRHAIELENGHMMILSGVGNDRRAQGGVGCIIKKTLTKHITKWDTVSERILLVELNLRKGNKIHVLILYGPNEDEKAETKDTFWDEVTTITESVKGDVIILGYLNGRVGRRDQRSGDVIGNHAEATRNNNGSRIIDFCIENNMLVMNTFFRHKDAHKYTREVSSRNEKSIIDYAIDIAERYREKVHELIEVSRNGDNCSLENMWNNFKHILLEAGRVTCGTIKINRGRKQEADRMVECRNQERSQGYNNQDNVLLVNENKISHPPGDAIEIEDVNTSIHKLKKGKAAGHDCITAEI